MYLPQSLIIEYVTLLTQNVFTVYIYIYIYISCGAAAQRWPWPPHS